MIAPMLPALLLLMMTGGISALVAATIFVFMLAVPIGFFAEFAFPPTL
jgi:hypothetical protein